MFSISVPGFVYCSAVSVIIAMRRQNIFYHCFCSRISTLICSCITFLACSLFRWRRFIISFHFLKPDRALGVVVSCRPLTARRGFDHSQFVRKVWWTQWKSEIIFASAWFCLAIIIHVFYSSFSHLPYCKFNSFVTYNISLLSNA